MDNASLILLALCAHNALDDTPDILNQTNAFVEEANRLVEILRQSA